MIISEAQRDAYLERREKDLLTCREAIQSKNQNELFKIWHQIKGNAATFGYNQLGNLALQIETELNTKDWRKIEISIDAFEHFILSERNERT